MGLLSKLLLSVMKVPDLKDGGPAPRETQKKSFQVFRILGTPNLEGNLETASWPEAIHCPEWKWTTNPV